MRFSQTQSSVENRSQLVIRKTLFTGKQDSFGMPKIFMDTEKNTGRSGCAVRALAYCDLHKVRSLKNMTIGFN